MSFFLICGVGVVVVEVVDLLAAKEVIGEHRPGMDVVVVVVDDAGDVEADEDDEDENDSLSFSSPEPETGVLICSSLAAARVSARIGFAFASMSPEEFSDASVDEDSLEQLRVSGTVVESG